MDKQTKVRFAPSPTGYLHIGGARTAIFNWLYARKNRGKFLLRIEDTDVERSDREMTSGILKSLDWLGLQWDDDIIYQSNNIEQHKKLAYKLLDERKAYQCFCTKDELALKKERTKEEKRAYKYDRTCLNLTKNKKEELISSGKKYAVRFLVPEGKTIFKDEIYGEIEFNNEEIEDFVILRSDGTPTYQLAVVHDDNMMGITHVIRGDDHLSNTPKQIMLYEALGVPVPYFAHLPLILGSDKKRLSKRHGAVSVLEYKNKGYLPEALFNYLSLLGWSPGDDREIMSREDIIKSFSFAGISKKSAVFDEVKLEWMNSEYISAMETERLYEKCLEMDKDYFAGKDKNYLLKVLDLIKPRLRRLDQVKNFSFYFYEDPKEYNAKSVKKYWRKNTAELLDAVFNDIEKLESFEADKIEEAVRRRAEKSGVSAAKLIHPIRICLTGSHVSPGLFEVMNVLGKEKVVSRIKRGKAEIRYERKKQ